MEIGPLHHNAPDRYDMEGARSGKTESKADSSKRRDDSIEISLKARTQLINAAENAINRQSALESSKGELSDDIKDKDNQRDHIALVRLRLETGFYSEENVVGMIADKIMDEITPRDQK